MRRRDGFILLELLVALAISGIALSLFWQASNNRIKMLTRLEGKYAFSRLVADINILRVADQPLDVDPSHYLPLQLKITAEEIQITSKHFKTQKVLKK